MANTRDLQITIRAGESDAHSVKVPPAGRITLSSEARQRLLDTDLVGDARPDGGMSESDWERLEDALLEILMPVRYVTGIDQATPPVPRDTEINIHNAGWRPIPLEDQIPGANNLRPPGHPDLDPKPRPKPGAGMTIQMVMDSHPERIQQQIAEEVRLHERRTPRRRDRHSW